MKYFIGHWAGVDPKPEFVEIPGRLAEKILKAWPACNHKVSLLGEIEWMIGTNPDIFIVKAREEQ